VGFGDGPTGRGERACPSDRNSAQWPVLRPSHVHRDIVAAVALDASADTPHYRRSVTAPRSLLCAAYPRSDLDFVGNIVRRSSRGAAPNQRRQPREKADCSV
jgi:hypothetical protein